MVLNYHCVLEARYLIEQHLRATGKDTYIGSSRDDFRSFKNVFVFLYRLLSKSSEIALSFGEPLDVIGNNVSVGHNAIVHGCMVHDNVLIGMGSIVMDNAIVHSNTIIAGGSAGI